MLAAEWPCVGRDAEIKRVMTLISAPAPRAVMLAGPEGSGKTHLLLSCLARAREAGLETRMHSGARYGIEPQLAPSLTTRADNRGPVTVIEDVHLLDGTAAATLHAMVADPDRPYLLTMREGEPVNPPIQALWISGLVERIDLRPLTQHDIHQLLEAVLGGPVDEALPMSLERRCRGNLVYLRELVQSAIQHDAIVSDHGIRRAPQPLPLNPRITELVSAKLAGLSPGERAAMETVALAGTAGTAEVEALLDVTTLEALERRRLVRTILAGRRLEVRVAEPIMEEVLIAETPGVRTRTLSRQLAEVLGGTGCRRAGDVLRLAQLRLLAGGGSAEAFVAGALAARSIQDLSLAEKLARAAIAEGAGIEAELLAATLAGLQGRDTECQRALLDLEARAITDQERERVALARDEHRVIWLGTSEPESTDTAARPRLLLDDELAASHIGEVVLTTGPAAGAAEAAKWIDDPRPNVRTWAAIVLGYSLARTGRCQEALRVATSGQASHSPVQWFASWDRWWHVFNRCEALLHSGRLDEAGQLAGTSYEHALSQACAEEQAFFAWQLCRISYSAGRLITAARYGRTAASIFRELGRTAYVRAAEINLALAEARAGRTDEAEGALAAVHWPGTSPPSMLQADYCRAQAWICASRGELEQARGHLRKGAADAAACADLAGESATLHDLVRLGDRTCGPRLQELAAASDSELDVVRVALAQAMTADEPERLEQTSTRFAQLGHMLCAAESAADAAGRWAKRGHARRSAAAERHARELAQSCEGTAAMGALTSRGTLTRAEHEAAALAAAGRSNREIAKLLVLSQSTVENRLQRVYHKLGITGRQELTDALGL